MLINVDVKSLEIVVAAELANDLVLKQEIIDKVDIHDRNRIAFRLGEGKPGRLVSKVLSFRILYGGSGYSFSKDPDFTRVSTSAKYWDGVIQEWYGKYKGIAAWHTKLLADVKKDGYITTPSGRFYEFKPEFKHGDWEWPLTMIKNYPVQGYGADLVMLARIEAFRLLKEAGLTFLMVGTIHDSIVVDTPEANLDRVATILRQAVENVPRLCKEKFGYAFSLPLTCEVQYGPNKLDMVEYKFT